MPGIEVAVVIPAPPEVVWADVADIASHVEWMHDAAAIRFTTDRRTGVGTAFDCDTKVGPIRLVDRMTITEWESGARMGVRHEGIVTGEGRFTLAPEPGGGTRFEWAESLRFPWFLGGPIGAWIARPVLRAIWRRNLKLLASRFS